MTTPRLDVRGVVFRGDEILLARDHDEGSWTLPGGWAESGESPSEAVAREVLEETGYTTRATKLLALYDRDRRGYPPQESHVWKAVFLCELEDEAQGRLAHETDAAAFFGPDKLPDPLHAAPTRNLIGRAFAHRAHPEWPTDFD